jgi:hypothetical protein
MLNILKVIGIYQENGKILLDSMKTLNWDNLTNKNLPKLDFGTSIDISLTIDENIFLSGKNGIVWATYDSRQADIIQNTLLAQQINCEIKKISFDTEVIFLIVITNQNEVMDAIDFIWKSDSGLRLNPDWSYPNGGKNKSFEQWLNGH